MTKIQNISPIDLSPYEDSLIETPGLDKSQGFGAWIRVETPLKGDKVTVQNLWDTANPGRRPGEDGLLSFEEAKGKTFYVPFYFCNNMAHWVIEVKNREDFRSLKDTLWAPLRNERISFNTCLDQGARSRPDAPSNPAPSPEEKPLAPEELQRMVVAMADWVQEKWGDPGQFAENFRNNFYGAMAAGVEASSLMALHVPGAVIQAGIRSLFQGLGAGEDGWDSSDAMEEEVDGEGLFEGGEEVEELEEMEWDDEEEEDDDPWG